MKSTRKRRKAHEAKPCELVLLSPPARAFTRASALKWLGGQRHQLMQLLSDIAQHGPQNGSRGCQGAYGLAEDVGALITAATEAIAFDCEVEIQEPRAFDDLTRASYLTDLVAIRSGERESERELMIGTNEALDEVLRQLGELLTKACAGDATSEVAA